jgi:cysteinyl-tRNA synthetase
MTIRVFNTATGRKEEFVSREPGKVAMYVCGVTVYDHCHLGHARGAFLFDVIRRYLAGRGYRVHYVRNFTDVDDKIIKRAAELGISWRELADRFIAEYRVDMEKLGVRPADVEPKATDHIPEMLAIVEGLVNRGYAYPVDGDVYFRVRAWAPYGRLSGRTFEEMQAGARVEVDERKEDPMDFALWKSSKPGEPSWESPWGLGRPGWHIECSAMSQKHLGHGFDIHGGGKDLVFPHHENEIAQSEAWSGETFARYWMHNGFVNVDREKMSKSLGNFFTIREILDRYDAEAVRLFLLSTHYRNPIDFSDKALSDSVRSLSRFYLLQEEADRRLAADPSPPPEDAAPSPLRGEVAQLRTAFREAMDDDFNTALATGEVFRTASLVGQALREDLLPDDECRRTLHLFREIVGEIAPVLGVFGSDPADWRARLESRQEKARAALPVEEIEEQIRRRNQARKERDFARADAIRRELAERGILIQDGPGGTTWRPAT